VLRLVNIEPCEIVPIVLALIVLYAYVRLMLKPIYDIDSLCVYVRLTLTPMRSCPLVCIASFVCLCPVDIKAYHDRAHWYDIDSFVCLCPVEIESFEIVPIGLH